MHLSTDEIILRGLDINGAGGAGGLDGIRFLAGGILTVEDTTINNMGVAINASLNQAATAEVHITNSYLRNNGSVGIFASNAGAGFVNVVIERTTSENNLFGVLGRNNSRIEARNSVFSGNTTAGVMAEVQSAGPTSTINVINCAVSGNGTGISGGNSAAAGQGKVFVSGTTISYNGTGVALGNGEVRTFQDNILRNNTADGVFTAPALTKN